MIVRTSNSSLRCMTAVPVQLSPATFSWTTAEFSRVMFLCCSSCLTFTSSVTSSNAPLNIDLIRFCSLWYIKERIAIPKTLLCRHISNNSSYAVQQRLSVWRGCFLESHRFHEPSYSQHDATIDWLRHKGKLGCHHRMPILWPQSLNTAFIRK